MRRFRNDPCAVVRERREGRCDLTSRLTPAGRTAAARALGTPDAGAVAVALVPEALAQP